MRSLFRCLRCAFPLLVLVSVCGPSRAQDPAEPQHLAGQVRSIFLAKCSECHGRGLSRPAVGPRLRILLAFIFASVAMLGASGVYLLAIRILELLRSQILQTQFSLWMILGHILLGVVIIVPFLIFGTLACILGRPLRSHPSAAQQQFKP